MDKFCRTVGDDKADEKQSSKQIFNKFNKKVKHIKKANIKKSEDAKKGRKYAEAQDEEPSIVSAERNGGGRGRVVFSTRCKYIRDTIVGLYCRLGTRKVRRVKKNGLNKIVCLDCDEPGKTYKDIKLKHFDKLWDKERNG